MRRLALISAMFLVSCGATAPLSLLTGGGPNVAANVQAGAENNQAVSQIDAATTRTNDAGRDIITEEKLVQTQAPVERIEIVQERIPPWVLLIGLIGWLLPTPSQMGESMGRAVMWLFRRNKHDV
jgi:hypothetical protein